MKSSKELIQSAVCIDKGNPFHKKKVDILIEKGKIVQIGEKIPVNDAKVISRKNLHVSRGWTDIRVAIGDPGFEHRETISSALNAAAKGGFTQIVAMPNTLPIVTSKAQIEHLISNASSHAVKLFPSGAITPEMKGNSFTEFNELTAAGALFLTDYKNSIQDADLFRRILLYSQSIGARIHHFPNDYSLFDNGQINESLNGLLTGLKPAPAIAEEIMVARDIQLAKYCNAPLHLSNISTKGSVELIRKAKAENIPITADTNSYLLHFTDNDVASFDTNLKTIPPLRSHQDQTALKEALIDGTLDTVCSDHCPIEIEEKHCAFNDALPGMINLQTHFSLLNSALSDEKDHLTLCIDLMTSRLNTILKNQDSKPSIKENSLANLTLFEPDSTFTFRKEDIVSLSKNSPLIGQELKGKVTGIFSNNQLEINDIL